MPVLSIIVPVYKVEKYIHKCVDSILSQSFTDFELILVDDGSPDGCGQICDEYAAKDARIKVIHKDNGGVSDARNAGLDVATGKYISFVDSDDWIAPETFVDAICQMQKNDVDMLKFGFVETDGKNSKTVAFSENKIYDTDLFSKYFDGVLWTIPCATVYKAELAKKVLFPENLLHEDNYSSGMYLYYAKRVQVIEKAYYYYRINLEGISKNNTKKKPLDKVLVVHKLITDLCALRFEDGRLYQKLATELYHFVRNGNDFYRVRKIDCGIYDFMVKNLNLRRKLLFLYWIKKRGIEVE